MAKAADRIENDVRILPRENAYRNSAFDTGDRVWKVFDDLRVSSVFGVINATTGMGGMVTVTWPNGKTRQEDPIYLLKQDELPVFSANRKQAFRKAILSTKGRKTGRACPKCQEELVPRVLASSGENYLVCGNCDYAIKKTRAQ